MGEASFKVLRQNIHATSNAADQGSFRNQPTLEALLFSGGTTEIYSAKYERGDRFIVKRLRSGELSSENLTRLRRE